MTSWCCGSCHKIMCKFVSAKLTSEKKQIGKSINELAEQIENEFQGKSQDSSRDEGRKQEYLNAKCTK